MPIGRSVALAAVGKQYDRGIFGQDQRVVAADQDWHADKMVPFVMNRMNITEKDGKSIYSGRPNGLGCIFVLVQNATADPSTGLKNISNAYDVLNNVSRKSRSDPDDHFVQPFTYCVHFETDGGTDHRDTLFQTRLHILMWKLESVLEFCT